MASANGNDEGYWASDELCSVLDRTRAWGVSRRSLLAAAGIGVLGGVTSGVGTVGAQEEGDYHHKTRPTLYTEKMRRSARENVQQYDWAASQRDSAVNRADAYLEQYASGADDPDLGSLWSLVTSQKIPRGGGTNPERTTLGGLSDPGTDRLWKIETTVDDPHGEGNFVLPTNDFAAYRESGLDDRGMFDPELADDSLLVNEEHPEMGEGWGVDDGWGWIDEDDDLGMGEGHRWNLVAYYNHWFIWRPGGVRRILSAMQDAYLLTGERKYAVAGLVVLDRLADVYPEMSIWDYQDGEHGFWNNHGGRQTGRIIGGSWEPNLARNLLRSYDALFPALDDAEVAEEVVPFLEGKTEEFPGLAGKDAVSAVRENIEENYVKEMLPAAEESDLVPTRGQLSTVAISARVADDVRENGYTREALEWLFQPGGEIFVGDVWDEEPENWKTTGGEVLTPIVDNCDRDGYWPEASPGYNRIQMGSIRSVAEALKGYDGFDGADLYQHPKFQSALKINSDLLLLDQFTPDIGDQHSPTGSAWSLSGVQDGYEVTGDTIYAQLWHYSNGYSTSGITGGIYDEDPEGLGDEIQEIIDAEGPLDLPSQNLAGYGFAALRSGENHRVVDIGDVTRAFLDMNIVDQSEEVKRYSDRGYIQLEATEPGEYIEFEFDVPEAGEHEVNFTRFKSVSYGIYEIYVNGELVETHDFYSDDIGFREEWYTLTEGVELVEGTNSIRFENVGANEDAWEDNYKFAVGDLQLLDEEAQELRDNVRNLGNTKRAFWLYYGRNGIEGGGTAHCHRDTLNLGVAAHDLDLTPDLGYPEQTGSWPKRSNWTTHTISHNTVTVDKSEQNQHWAATPRHFDGENERVNLIDVEAPHAYDETDEYRRTTAMIEVDDEHSYAVDFFRVAGGEDHVFSFHGQKGEATAEGADLVAQDGGTFAGEDVPKPGYGEDTEYNQEVGSGFNYLDNVERDADPAETVAIDWEIEDHWGHRSDDAEDVHMRLTAVGDFNEVALADGHPPDHDNNPDALRYALLRHRGSDLESDFVSTIEHYEGERAVDSVEKVPVEGGDGHAVKVDLASGRTDYVVCAFKEDGVVTIDGEFEFKGFFGVYSVEDGEPEYAYVHDGTKLEPVDGDPLINESQGEVRGHVADFTREMSLENELTAAIASGRKELNRHAGFVYVDNDDSNPWRGEPDPKDRIEDRGQRGRGNGAYPIEDLRAGSGNTVTVDVGDKTFTRDFVDPDRLADGGYHYVIAEEDDLRVPLTATWSKS